MKKIILLNVLILLLSYFGAQGQIAKKETDKSKIIQLKNHSAKAKKTYPSIQEIDKSKNLSQEGKAFFKKLRTTIDEASRITDSTTIEEYNAIMSDLEWSMFIIKTFSSNSNGGTNSGSTAKRRGASTMSGSSWVFVDGGDKDKTCATKCRDEYNRCMTENDCNYDRDSFFGICLCCVPCSLQYGGCLAACVIGNNDGIIQ